MMMMAQKVDLAALAVLIMAVPVALIACGLYWRRHGRPDTIERLSPLWRPFLAVTLAQAVCYHSAIDPTLAAAQLLVWLGYLAVFYLARLAPRRWILALLRGLGWIVAIVCLVEMLATGGRAGVWLQNNPNKVGGLLTVLLPLTGNYLWLVVGGAGLLATGSRGAAMGMMASATANVLPGRKEQDLDRLLAFIAVVFLAAITLCGMIRPATIVNRWETWQEAAGLFIERPLTGWGPGCYTRLAVYEPGHPHADNWPLTVAAEMGFVGLAVWCWVAVAVARMAARSPGRARLALVAFGVHNLVDATFWWWWIGIVVMVCLALLDETNNSEV